MTGEWGGVRFNINRPMAECDAWVVFESLPSELSTKCPPERLVFVTGEPSGIGHYSEEFLAQFGVVVTSHRGLKHPNVIHLQQGHPWFVEKSFDDLLTYTPEVKTAEICVISSDKAFTPGHQRRLDFVREMKSRLGDRLDVFGRGIRDFESKWELLKAYRYCVVLENCEENDFLTEKLPDALLAYCFPFYAGAPNVARYFPTGGCEQISMSNFDASIEVILKCIDNPDHYQNSLESLATARNFYLHHNQFFANMAAVIQLLVGVSPQAKQEVVLKPNTHFLTMKSVRKHGLLSRVWSRARRLGAQLWA
jgi:hypothetical protein